MKPIEFITSDDLMSVYMRCKYHPYFKDLAESNGGRFIDKNDDWEFTYRLPMTSFINIYRDLAEGFTLILDDFLEEVIGEDIKSQPHEFNFPLVQPRGILPHIKPMHHQLEGLSHAWTLKKSLLGLPPGSGKCVDYKTEIMLSSGQLVEIGKLFDMHDDGTFDGCEKIIYMENQVHVPSFNESTGIIEHKRVSHLYKQLVNEKLNTLSFDNKCNITLTDNHPLLSIDFSSFGTKWVNSYDLHIGDYVAIPKTMPEPSVVKRQDINLVKFLAWQIAEGHESIDENNSHSLTISQKEESLANRISSFGENFGLDVNKRKGSSGKDVHIISIKKVNSYATLLKEELGYEWGFKSSGKKIPQGIISLPNIQLAEFIREFFEAEGHVGSCGIGITSASSELIKQLVYLLKRFSIHSSVSSKMSRATNSANPVFREYYRMTISGDSARTFKDVIGFVSDRKNNKLLELTSRKSNANKDIVPGEYAAMLKLCEVIETPENLVFGNSALSDHLREGKQPNRKTIIEAIAKFRKAVNGELLAEKQQAVVSAQQAGRHFRAINSLKSTVSKLLRIKELNIAKALLMINELELFLNSDIMVTKVIDITNEIHKFVYDITVEDNHNFIGGSSPVVMHNSLVGKMLKELADIPFTVFSPACVKFQWKQEIMDMTGRQSIVIDGTKKKRDKLYPLTENFEWMIMNYEILVNDGDSVPKRRGVIIDEAHFLKNPDSKRTKAMMKYIDGADYVLLLTGTFLVNSLLDAFPLMQMTGNVGMNESLFMFKKKHCILDKYDNPVGFKPSIVSFKKDLKKATYYRQKEEILDLPERMDIHVDVQMGTKQSAYYKKAIDGILMDLNNPEVERLMDAQAQYTRLRQISADPYMIFMDELNEKENKERMSAKIDWIENFTQSFEERTMIIYNPFNSFLERIKQELPNNPWVHIHGGIPSAKRNDLINYYKNSKEKAYFLITDAMKTGMNIQFCNNFIFSTLPLTFADYDQLLSRIYRQGQKDTVFIYHLKSLGTIDHNNWELVQSKKDLMNDFKVHKFTTSDLKKAILESKR